MLLFLLILLFLYIRPMHHSVPIKIVRTLTYDWISLKKWRKIWPRNKCIDIVQCLGWHVLTSCVMIVLVGEQWGRWRGRWTWSWSSAKLYWSAWYLRTVKWFFCAYSGSKHEDQNVLNSGLVLIHVQGSLGYQDMIHCYHRNYFFCCSWTSESYSKGRYGVGHEDVMVFLKLLWQTGQ